MLQARYLLVTLGLAPATRCPQAPSKPMIMPRNRTDKCLALRERGTERLPRCAAGLGEAFVISCNQSHRAASSLYLVRLG